MIYLIYMYKEDLAFEYLTDKMKRNFFQAAVVSILLYGCTIWTLTKRLEKKLDGNYTRMLRAILNKSWWQHPTKHQLYGHLPAITKTIQARRTRHAGHCWRSRDELISDVLLWTLTYGRAKAGQPARKYIQHLFEDTDVALKICQRQWTIGRSGERGSGISVQAARHDHDDGLYAINQTKPKHIYSIYMYKEDLAFIILSCHQHGYPWPSLPIPPYCSSLLTGPQGYILYPHKAVVCRFKLVSLLLLGHVRESIGEHPLRLRPRYSSSVLLGWFV